MFSRLWLEVSQLYRRSKVFILQHLKDLQRNSLNPNHSQLPSAALHRPFPLTTALLLIYLQCRLSPPEINFSVDARYLRRWNLIEKLFLNICPADTCLHNSEHIENFSWNLSSANPISASIFFFARNESRAKGEIVEEASTSRSPFDFWWKRKNSFFNKTERKMKNPFSKRLASQITSSGYKQSPSFCSRWANFAFSLRRSGSLR